MGVFTAVVTGAQVFPPEMMHAMREPNYIRIEQGKRRRKIALDPAIDSVYVVAMYEITTEVHRGVEFVMAMKRLTAPRQD